MFKKQNKNMMKSANSRKVKCPLMLDRIKTRALKAGVGGKGRCRQGNPRPPRFREGGRALAEDPAHKSEDGKPQPLKPISSPHLKILPHRLALERVQAELLLSSQAAIKKSASRET